MTVRDVVAASDAVVIGNVVATSTGRTVVDISYRAIEFQVDEVLSGSVSDTAIVIEEEAGIVEPEGVVEVAPSHWSDSASAGETWLVALSYKKLGSEETGRPTYAVLGMPGFFLVTEDGVRTTSDVLDDQGRSVATLTLEELKEAFKAAAGEQVTVHP